MLPFSSFYGLLGLGAALQHSADQERTSANAATQKAQLGAEVQHLDDRVDKLVLACCALWELLKERTNLTEDDLLEKVREVDLRDGTEDGKITRRVKKCPACGRTMSPRHSKCLYCGAADLTMGAFDSAS